MKKAQCPQILTASMFSNHLEKDGDFRKIGHYIVKDLILLAGREILHEVNLGNGIFKGPFISNNSYFEKNFDCGNSLFESELAFRKTCCVGNLIYKGEIVN